MTSERFPGKVLAPLCGRPVIAHAIDRLRKVAGMDRIVLVTSEEGSDDPLAAFANSCLGLEVFRGSLGNVSRRFQDCLLQIPCDWFVRISGDSPFIDAELVSHLLSLDREDFDLVTNVGVRTFPPGQSVEIVRTSTFRSLDLSRFDQEEQEHVTLHFYRQTTRFRILNVRSSDPSIAERRMVVDTISDLQAMSRLLAESPDLTSGFARFAETAP